MIGFNIIQRTSMAIICLLTLSACASPNVDTKATTFNEVKYTEDLNNCRGGTILGVALNGIGGAIVGSAYGVTFGAYHGALAGDSKEGAVIGAVLGSVIGVVAGAYEPFKKKDREVAACLSGKGYTVQS